MQHVSSTTTTPFNKTRNKEKAVECIPPPQGELTEADYDLGVLSCATTSATIVGQICVPSDDSTLGGYCMDPLLPLTYLDGRQLLKRYSNEGLLLQYCEDKVDKTAISPIDSCYCGPGFLNCRVDSEKVLYRTCDFQTQTYISYNYQSDGSLSGASKCITVYAPNSVESAAVCYSIYPQGYCYFPSSSGKFCKSCYSGDGTVQECPATGFEYYSWSGGPQLCGFRLYDSDFNFFTGCVTELSPKGSCKADYRANYMLDSCRCKNMGESVMIECTILDKDFSIDTSREKPFEYLPLIEATCTPKPTKAPKRTKAPKPTKAPAPKPTKAPAPKPTKAPKPKKTPKPKKPRQLVSSEETLLDVDADSAEERALIDSMNILLDEELTAPTEEDANAK